MIIYKITNKVNGKIYIGCTVLPLYKRFQAHYWKRNEGDTALKRAFLKYGKDAFYIIEIDKAINREEMLSKEKYWIAFFNSMNTDIGYNLHEGGACLGRNATIDEKEMNRRRNIGKVCLPETRLKISLAQKGVAKNPISVEKARLSKIGKKQSPEQIKNRALSRVGFKHSNETKHRITVSNLGQKRSEEAKLKMSLKKKKYCEENKNVLGEHIVCINNGKVYFSHSDASTRLNIGRNGITRQVNGVLKQTHGYQFQKLTAEHLIF